MGLGGERSRGARSQEVERSRGLGVEKSRGREVKRLKGVSGKDETPPIIKKQES